MATKVATTELPVAAAASPMMMLIFDTAAGGSMYVRYLVTFDKAQHPAWAEAIQSTCFGAEVTLDNGLRLRREVEGLVFQRGTYPLKGLELDDFDIVRVEITENDVMRFPRMGVYEHRGAKGFANSYGHSESRHWDLTVAGPDLESATRLYDLIRSGRIRPVVEYRAARRTWSWRRFRWV